MGPLNLRGHGRLTGTLLQNGESNYICGARGGGIGRKEKKSTGYIIWRWFGFKLFDEKVSLFVGSAIKMF